MNQANAALYVSLELHLVKLKKETHETEKWAYLIDIKLVDEVRQAKEKGGLTVYRL